MKISSDHDKAQTKKQEYVLGFCFSTDMKRVVLIRKNRPNWQKGLLNGVGGKIEPGEIAIDAMRREFKEEAGVEIKHWDPFTVFNAPDFKIYMFWTTNHYMDAITSVTDEQVGIYQVSTIPLLKTVPHLQWLVPMVINHQEEQFKCEVEFL
jgi:8-oxo-dGTP diphosphatase